MNTLSLLNQTNHVTVILTEKLTNLNDRFVAMSVRPILQVIEVEGNTFRYLGSVTGRSFYRFNTTSKDNAIVAIANDGSTEQIMQHEIDAMCNEGPFVKRYAKAYQIGLDSL